MCRDTFGSLLRIFVFPRATSLGNNYLFIVHACSGDFALNKHLCPGCLEMLLSIICD